MNDRQLPVRSSNGRGKKILVMLVFLALVLLSDTEPASLNLETADANSLTCNGPATAFESGIPADWTSIVNTGQVYWSTTDDLNACDNGGNLTGGSGAAACADSDKTNLAGDPYDAELWSNSFSLANYSAAELHFALAYKDHGSADKFEIWVWNGVGWILVAYADWDYFGNAVVDLTGFAGMPWVGVAFRYYGDGWDWYAQVDDVVLSCTGLPPDMDVDPLAMGSTQEQNAQVTLPLDINNTGGAPLNWQIVEASGQNCQTPSDISWLSEAPSAGTTAAASTTTIDVNFNSNGLSPGIYNGTLCISSNDPDPGPGNWTDLVVVPVELIVEAVPQPNMDVDPLAMGSTQEQNAQVTLPLDINNTGSAPLNWQIVEASGQNCQTPSDISWLSEVPSTGTTAVASTTMIDMNFNSNGLSPGIYNGTLCISSNDPDPGPGNGTDLVKVPVELVVEAVPQPNMDVVPLAIGSTQEQNAQVTLPLDINNTGSAPLNWQIVETSGQNCQTPSDISWLSEVPSTGTTAVAGTTMIDVNFNSNGLSPGIYDGTLCISSNDPDPGPGNGTDLVVVPVELIVEAVPQPNMDVDPLAMGSTQEQNAQVTLPLDINNTGSAPLNWQIVEASGQNCLTPSDISWLSEVPSTGTTAVAGTTMIDVNFNSNGLTPGVYDGTLCISSNDPDPGPGNGTDLVKVPVELIVEAVPQPNMDVDPLAIGSTQGQNAQVTLPLDINNTGSAPLNWQIAETSGQNCQTPSDISWLSEAPSTGTTAVASTTMIDVNFNSNGLTPGIYNGTLCISSNDPDPGPGNGTDLVVVPVELIVADIPPDLRLYLPIILRE